MRDKLSRETSKLGTLQARVEELEKNDQQTDRGERVPKKGDQQGSPHRIEKAAHRFLKPTTPQQNTVKVRSEFKSLGE